MSCRPVGNSRKYGNTNDPYRAKSRTERDFASNVAQKKETASRHGDSLYCYRVTLRTVFTREKTEIRAPLIAGRGRVFKILKLSPGTPVPNALKKKKKTNETQRNVTKRLRVTPSRVMSHYFMAVERFEIRRRQKDIVFIGDNRPVVDGALALSLRNATMTYGFFLARMRNTRVRMRPGYRNVIIWRNNKLLRTVNVRVTRVCVVQQTPFHTRERYIFFFSTLDVF